MKAPDYTRLAPAMFLAVTAGSLDAFTFLHQGAVFAGLQTGNLILLGVHLGAGEWGDAGHYALTLAMFALGTALARMVQHLYPVRAKLPRATAILLIELALVLLAVGLGLGGPLPQITWLLAITAAFQLQEFRQLHGSAFTSLMMTGNLRLLVAETYDWLIRRQAASRAKVIDIGAILLSFASGAALITALSNHFGRLALLLAAVGLVGTLVSAQLLRVNAAE